MTISVIIPCFNEYDRICQTVSLVRDWQHSCQIIVVDDGSASPSKKFLHQLKGVDLITHPTNLGKSRAIASGLKIATGNIIIFLDADLINLTGKDLDILIKPIIHHQADMVVADYISPLPKPLRLLYGGQRAFLRQQILPLAKLLSQPTGRIAGYTLEPVLNQHFFSKHTVFVKFPQVRHYSENQKSGYLLGSFKYLRGFLNNLHHLGLNQFIYQLTFILRHI